MKPAKPQLNEGAVKKGGLNPPPTDYRPPPPQALKRDAASNTAGVSTTPAGQTCTHPDDLDELRDTHPTAAAEIERLRGLIADIRREAGCGSATASGAIKAIRRMCDGSA